MKSFFLLAKGHKRFSYLLVRISGGRITGILKKFWKFLHIMTSLKAQ